MEGPGPLVWEDLLVLSLQDILKASVGLLVCRNAKWMRQFRVCMTCHVCWRLDHRHGCIWGQENNLFKEGGKHIFQKQFCWKMGDNFLKLSPGRLIRWWGRCSEVGRRWCKFIIEDKSPMNNGGCECWERNQIVSVKNGSEKVGISRMLITIEQNWNFVSEYNKSVLHYLCFYICSFVGWRIVLSFVERLGP